MQSIKELYKIGRGPSSSHTLACERACKLFIEEYGLLSRYEVELYGSLSLTGKGHMTDKIIIDTLKPALCDLEFKLNWEEEFPNGFYIKGYNSHDKLVAKWTIFSIGGGSIKIKEKKLHYNDEIYDEKSLDEIKHYLDEHNIDLYTYIEQHEDDLEDHLYQVLYAMIKSVENGLNQSVELPGKLHVLKSAKDLYIQSLNIEDPIEKQKLTLMAYAYSANEENASGHQVVTAPTLGACGILAAIMTYYYKNLHTSRTKLVRSLAVAGIFGNLIKQNATISGAVGGCQAEVGAACAMGCAAIAYLEGLSLKQIEYAAEIGIEHHLGLTCDPVGGYVIIPCIERNAVATLRAFDAVILSKYMSKIKDNKVTFDTVVHTMNYTGKKLAYELKETSLGGLASEFKEE